MRADGLAAVRLGALRRLLQEPVQVAVQRLERVARGVAAGLLEDALGLARDYERILSVLRHSQSPWSDGCARPRGAIDRFYPGGPGDRKSTRLNSSHGYISYAVFCLKKKKPRN